MIVQLVLMVKKITVSLSPNSVVLQLFGFPLRRFVNPKLDNAQVELTYQVLPVNHMCLARMGKHGILPVSCASVLIIPNGMEIGVFLVQVEKYGFLEKVVNVVKDNSSQDLDVKL